MGNVGLKSWAKRRIRNAFDRRGLEIVAAANLYDWQRDPGDGPSYNDAPLPAGAATYLRPDNPKLLELERRYREFDARVTTPLLWTNRHVRQEDIAFFRGDNAWVWQVRGTNSNILAYALGLYYLRSIDHLGLLDRLDEDKSFGNFTFHIADCDISRDLLNSVAEIYFLLRHLRINSRPGFRVLDIGAGYGRLAHRVMTAMPAIESYVCTDAVAVSTFVCDYYLRFRGVGKAEAVPLDAIDGKLAEHPVDLAINIHSFPECRLEAIEWWCGLLRKHRVKWFMIVLDREGLRTIDGHDFLPVLQAHGYHPVIKEPKFLDRVVQQYGLFPDWHYLLELRS